MIDTGPKWPKTDGKVWEGTSAYTTGTEWKIIEKSKPQKNGPYIPIL